MAQPRFGPQQVAGRIALSPLGRHLGFAPGEAERDRVVLRLPFREELTTVGDQVHGGAIASLIDAAATAVAWSGVDPENPPSRGTTVNLEVSFLSAARAQELIATATVARRGRSICFCNVDVHGADGSLLAQGRAVYKLG